MRTSGIRAALGVRTGLRGAIPLSLSLSLSLSLWLSIPLMCLLVAGCGGSGASDMAAPDLATSFDADQVVRDQSTPSDSSSADLGLPADLAAPADLGLRDLSSPADLFDVRDL